MVYGRVGDGGVALHTQASLEEEDVKKKKKKKKKKKHLILVFEERNVRAIVIVLELANCAVRVMAFHAWVLSLEIVSCWLSLEDWPWTNVRATSFSFSFSFTSWSDLDEWRPSFSELN